MWYVIIIVKRTVRFVIKVIFFDIDNTLLDFDESVRYIMRSGCEKFGLGKYSEEMFSVFLEINGRLWRQIENGSLTLPELEKIRWNMIFERLGIDFDGIEFEKYFREVLFDSAVKIEGADEALSYLSGKYVLCAASNGPEAQQRNRLGKSGLLGYFKAVYVSEGVGAEKPSGEFFSYCIADIGTRIGERISPDEIMMVGDSLNSDVRGAIDSGLKACYFDRSDIFRNENYPEVPVIYSLISIKDFM